MEQILVLAPRYQGIERLLAELHINFGNAAAVAGSEAMLASVGCCTVAIIAAEEASDRLISVCFHGTEPIVVVILGENLLAARSGQMTVAADANAAEIIAAITTARSEFADTARTRDIAGYFSHMIGGCEEMQTLFTDAAKVARADSTVHIRGESGTGKELIARAIHDLSVRAGKPFVAVNCAAIPDELLESELFGHKKGSFTGAIADKMGKFQQADGGTLFLDEIGDMKPSLQVKLLRVLQSREISPVGSTKATKIDVRIISATHQNLELMVDKKQFREDLYYRLAVFPLNLPPLRARSASDVIALLEHFRSHFNTTKNFSVAGFDQDALDILSIYQWPGNVRELENFVERMVVTVESGYITIDDIPERYFGERRGDARAEEAGIGLSGICLNSAVDALEIRMIKEALMRSCGNRKAAAGLLNLKRTTLLEKIKKFGLEQCHLHQPSESSQALT